MFLAAEIIYVLLKHEAEGHKTERRYFLCFHMKKGDQIHTFFRWYQEGISSISASLSGSELFSIWRWQRSSFINQEELISMHLMILNTLCLSPPPPCLALCLSAWLSVSIICTQSPFLHFFLQDTNAATGWGRKLRCRKDTKDWWWRNATSHWLRCKLCTYCVRCSGLDDCKNPPLDIPIQNHYNSCYGSLLKFSYSKSSTNISDKHKSF